MEDWLPLLKRPDMSRTVAEIPDDALTLPEPDRAKLLAATLSSRRRSLHPAWGSELRRRAAAIDAGQVQPVAWEEVRRQFWAELGR